MYGLGAEPTVSREEAKRAVRSIYLELLLRDPWDPYDAAAEGYVNCLTGTPWRCDIDFVRTEVIASPEYKDKELARARAVYGAPVQSGVVTTSGLPPLPGAAPAGGGIMEMSIGGIPLPYLAGGLVLLMLLKRR
jgi:hypothetical protein